MTPRIIKVIFLLLFISTGLNAAEVTWVNAFPFYVYGDVSFIASVYEFVSEVVTDTSVQTMFALGFTIAILIAGYEARMGGGVGIAKSIIAPITLYALFIVPTVNVHITDLRTDKGLITYTTPDGGYKKVEKIPFAIAAIPASSSMLVSVFIDLIDDNWASISLGSQFSSLGYQGISQINKEAMMISQLEDINDTNIGDVAYDLNQYIKHCLIRKAFAVDTSNRHILTHPTKPFPEMWNPVNFEGSLDTQTVSFDEKKDASGQPVDGKTCGDLYTAYVSSVDNDIETGMKELLALKFPGIDPDGSDLNDAWSDQTGVDLNIVGNIGKAMTTTAMTRILEQSFNVEGIGVSGVAYATELSMQSTMANLRTEGLAKWEWLTRTLPDAILIVMAILIGAFPLMIIVMSFLGKIAVGGIANFFMGYVAINFNLVSLALVNNIISYYTAQHAQEAIVSYAGMPFGLTQIGDFMMQQADMAGFAGIVGAASIFAVTPLIFKGETAGFGAAMGALAGAYRGNVQASASKELTDYDAQMAIDKKVTTADGMTEAEASAWLSGEGFTKPANMSAVESYNAMMKNYGAIGAADSASIMHSGNAGKFNTENYIAGSAGQSMQSMGKTAGLGANMNSGGANSANMAEIESVSIQDGEAMGSMLNKTSELRQNSSSYDAEAVGAGQAIGQFGKDMGSALLSKIDTDAAATTANSTNAVASQVGAGKGLLKTGAFNSDGTLIDGAFNEDGSLNANNKAGALIKGAGLASLQKANAQIGSGEVGSFDDYGQIGLQDGQRTASSISKQAELRNSRDYNPIEDGEGQGISTAAKDIASTTLAKIDKNGDATIANAVNATSTQVGAGQGNLISGGLDEDGNRRESAFNEDGTLNFDGNGNLSSAASSLIKGAKLNSLKKTNEQIGTGDVGVVGDYEEVATEDGHIIAKSVNDTNKRRNELDGKNGTEAWDEDKIADGTAIQSTQQQIKTQGVSNSLEKEGQDNSDAFRQAAMGSEFTGRKEENDMLGTGKKWTEMTNHNNDDIKLMADEQTNAAVASIGGIQATNAEIMKHGGRDGAIKDMVTAAQSKGIQSAADAETLRDNYGDNHGDLTKGKALLNNKQKAALQTQSDEVAAQIDELQNKGELTKPEKSQLASLQSQQTSLQDSLKHADDTMTLEEVSKNIAQSKLDSTRGQAAGIQENVNDAGVSYAQNAMYGEMSQQQSTKAKLDAQGGVEGAIHTDVADASLKAAKQQDSLVAEIQQQIKVNNPKASDDEAKKIAEGFVKGGEEASKSIINAMSKGIDINAASVAVASAGALAGTMTGGKTKSDIKAVGQFDSSEDYISAQGDVSAYKSGQTKATSTALHTKNSDGTSYINEDGDVTTEGQTSLNRQEQDKMGEQLKRESSYSDTEHMQTIAGKIINNGRKKEERIRAAQDMVEKGLLTEMPQLDSDGKVSNSSTLAINKDTDRVARAFGEARGELLTDKMGGLVFGGYESSIAGEAVKSTKDNSSTTTEGKKHVVNATDAKTKLAENAAEDEGVDVSDVMDIVNQHEADVSPVKRANAALSAMEVKEQKEKKEHLATNPENDGTTPSTFLSDHSSDALNLASDAALGYAAVKGIDGVSTFVANDKIPMTKEDMASKGYEFGEDGKIKDKNGNIVTEKDGKFYDSENKVLEKPNPKKKAGPIERGVGKVIPPMKNAVVKVAEKTGLLNPSSSDNFTNTKNDTFNGSKDEHGSDNKEGVTGNDPDNIQHGNSLNKDGEVNPSSKDSIAKSGESSKYENGGKPTTPAEEIDQQYKADKRNTTLQNIARERDNLLNVTDDPEKRANIEKQYDAKMEAVKEQYPTPQEKAIKHEAAMKAAQEKMNKPDLSSPSEKGFMSRAKDFFGGAKGVATGMFTGFGASLLGDELVQTTLDHGNTQRANVYQAVVNTADGFGNAVLGGVTYVAGGVDAVANAVTGTRPIGSATAWAGITKDNNLLRAGEGLVNEGVKDVGTAMLNAQDAYNGSDAVIGRTKGGETAFGKFAGYGSISQVTGNSTTAPTATTEVKAPASTTTQPTAPVAPSTTAEAAPEQQRTSWVNQGQVMLGSPQPSPAPAYAQNAFSTPIGFNTMQDMNANPAAGSKTTYNDNTSNINTTPQEYKSNTEQESLDKASDTAMGTEYTQEAVDRMNETITKLSETIYKGEE